MSNTTIIECIKSRSNVNGKTRWTTQIGDGGIVLSPGDIIEVEGAAINSRGIGGDVIEIPEDAVNGIYQNKAYIDFGYYITNRGEDCCPLPQYYQTTWGAEAWNGVGNGYSPTGKYDIKYGLLADPDAYSFYYDPLAGGNAQYINGHATSANGDILQSGGFNVVGFGADGRRVKQPGGDPWTPLHRNGNFSSALLPATAITINAINCDRDIARYKRGGSDQNSAAISRAGGCEVDGKNYGIIRQAVNNGRAKEFSFNECPWTRLTYRKEINTKAGFKNPSSIAEEITEALHGAFVEGDTKQLYKPEYANLSPKLMFMNTGGGASGDVSCLLPGIKGTAGNGKDVVNGHGGAGDQGGTVGDLGTIGGQYLNEKAVDFNGATYLTLPANPHNLIAADEGGGGWSCRYIGALHPDRIIAGTNLTTLPRKIGHPDEGNGYILQDRKGADCSVINIAAATLTYNGTLNHPVNSLKNMILRTGDGNGGEFFHLTISSNVATTTAGDTVLVFRENYYSGGRATKIQAHITQFGFTLVSNKNNSIMNLNEIPVATDAEAKYSVIITNIPFSQTDFEMLDVPNQYSIHTAAIKQRLVNYFHEGRKYKSNNTAQTAAAIALDNENWYNTFDFGRGRSSMTNYDEDASHLPCPWITDQVAGKGGTTTQYLKQTSVSVYSKYDETIYDQAFLDAGTVEAGYFIDKGPQTYGVVAAVDGKLVVASRPSITAKRFSEENDIMVVCVKRKKPHGVIAPSDEYYANGTIGFIIKEKNNTATAVPRYNYCGFNPSYSYPGNECVALINTNRVRNAQGATVAVNSNNGTGTTAQKARFQYYRDINTWGQSGFTHTGGSPDNVINSVLNRDAAVMDYPYFCWMNYINIGSPEILVNWDNVSNRFSLEKLHKETVITNAKATGTLATPVPVPDAGSPILEFNKAITKVLPGGLTEYDLGTVVSSQAGLSIIHIGGYNDAATGALNLDGDGAYELTEANFIGSFWDRLGFSFYDLVGFKGVGDQTNAYNENTQGNYAGAIHQAEQLYPITTNAALTTSVQADLDIGGGAADDLGLPMYGLGYYRGWEAFPSQEGAKILARSLPKKLTYPYWLLYSNIVGNAEFFSGDKKKNCLGIITRNYTAGDFAYAFNMNRQFIVQRNTVLTEITQEILNPDFTPADIDDYSVVLYKITRRNGLPDESGDPYEQDGLPQKGGANAGKGADKRAYK